MSKNSHGSLNISSCITGSNALGSGKIASVILDDRSMAFGFRIEEVNNAVAYIDRVPDRTPRAIIYVPLQPYSEWILPPEYSEWKFLTSCLSNLNGEAVMVVAYEVPDTTTNDDLAKLLKFLSVIHGF